ncbi:hypothetical protein ACLOJK_008362 [Asimina triloba]
MVGPLLIDDSCCRDGRWGAEDAVGIVICRWQQVVADRMKMAAGCCWRDEGKIGGGELDAAAGRRRRWRREAPWTVAVGGDEGDSLRSC